MLEQAEISIYIHIPFCSYKCPYCHFYVLQDKEALKEALLQGLFQELALWQEVLSKRNIVSVYFGGGTPTLFGAKRLQSLLSQLTLSDDVEITIEANPEQITPTLMNDLYSIGINRVSIGVQSFVDNELIQLGRRHQATIAQQAIEITATSGFTNISIDLMYEVPTQTLNTWQYSLDIVKNLPITHLSLYNLTIEPYTAFAKKEHQLRKLLPDAETGTIMYQHAIDDLSAIGLKQYEISAFAHQGMASRHNSGYWNGREFLGFGPSAWSLFENRRFSNIPNLTRYCKQLEVGTLATDCNEILSTESRQRELLALHLRLLDGVNLTHFKHLQQETLLSIDHLITMDLLMKKENRLRLTQKGIFFYDEVASSLI